MGYWRIAAGVTTSLLTIGGGLEAANSFGEQLTVNDQIAVTSVNLQNLESSFVPGTPTPGDQPSVYSERQHLELLNQKQEDLAQNAGAAVLAALGFAITTVYIVKNRQGS